MEPVKDRTKAMVADALRARFGVRLPAPSLHKQHEPYRGKVHRASLQQTAADWVASFEVSGGVTPSWLWLTSEYPSDEMDGSASQQSTVVLVEQRVQPGHMLPRMSVVKLGFDARAFRGAGTLLAGEIVRTPTATVFLASDLLAEAGEALATSGGEVPFGDRLVRLHHFVAAAHMPDVVGDPMLLRVRPYVSLPQLHAAAREGLPLDYGGQVLGVVIRSLHHGSRSVFKAFPPVAAVAADRSQQQGQRQRHGPSSGGVDVDEDEDDDDEHDGGVESADRQTYSAEAHTFYVRATVVPDVFELRPGPSIDTGPVEVAAVPTLSDSTRLREAAASGAPMLFERRARFGGKWVPCSL
jgi:hypothetical protein